MPVQEIVVDQKPLDLNPVDTSVRIPESVRRAAAHAESFYAQTPAQQEQPPAQQEQPPAQQEEQQPPAAQQEQPPAQQEQPPAQHQERKMADGSIDWEHRYLSMKGRYDASQRTIGSMQEQMQQLGDELVRTQTLLQRSAPVQPDVNRPANDHTKLITPQDEENYGTDLIDLTRRAAREAVAPDLEDVRSQNNELQQRVLTNSRNEMYAELGAAVPNWREINSSPQFKRWLSLRDVYSGGVRQQMLNAAHGAADTPRVIAFFKGFLSEARATGQQAQDPPPAQDQLDPPRQAAMSLDSLAAPGRAKPASGNELPIGAADKPVYTRAQISQFYRDVNRGVYRGNEKRKDEIEQSIYAAQREGRVR